MLDAQFEQWLPFQRLQFVFYLLSSQNRNVNALFCVVSLVEKTSHQTKIAKII